MATPPGVQAERRNLTSPPPVISGPAVLALCGRTKKGPVEDPDNSRVSSWDEFVAKFGDLDETLSLPLMLQAYFNEGGQQAIINRIVATDAVKASKSWTEGGLYTLTSTPTGARGLVGASDHSAAGNRQFSVTLGALTADVPYIIRAWVISAVNAISAGGDALQGTTAVSGTPSSLSLVSGTAYNVGATASQKRLEPGSVRVQLNTAGAGPIYYDKGDGTFIVAGTLTAGTIDYNTGAIGMTFSSPLTAGHTIRVSMRRIVDRVEKRIVISGADVFSGDYDSGGTNTVNRTTGAVVFTMGAAMFIADGVAQGTYTLTTDGYNWDATSETGEGITKIELDGNGDFFTFTALYEGTWGNSVRLAIEGDVDYFTEATQTYSRVTIAVQQLTADATWETISGTFRQISLTTPADANYITTVLNSITLAGRVLSAAVNDGGFPSKLNGIQATNVLLGTGAGAAIAVDTTKGALGRRSINITYTDTSARAHVITDDGLGNLVGSDPSGAASLDATAVASVDYDTGRIIFTTGQLVVGSGLVELDFYTVPQVEAIYVQLASGADGSALTRAMISATALSATKEGMYALSKIRDNMTLALPDFAGDEDVAADQLAYADGRSNIFVLLSTPEGYTKANAKAYRQAVLASNSAAGVLLFPWLVVQDPLTDTPVTIPPMGTYAGICSRTDRARSPGKTPAGVEDGAIRWALGLERKLDLDIDVGDLNDAGIICLVDDRQTGRAVWGGRTLLRARKEFGAYVVDTRVQNHAASVTSALLWRKVFEPNTPGLWSQIQRDVTAVIKQTLYDRGALKGSSQSDAFIVVCNATNNNADSDEVFVDVYVATSKPAQFFKVRVSQKQQSA